jgi:hypothetical protein
MTRDSSASQLALPVQFDCPYLVTFADYADHPHLATTSSYFRHEQLYSVAHYAAHSARRHKHSLRGLTVITIALVFAAIRFVLDGLLQPTI